MILRRCNMVSILIVLLLFMIVACRRSEQGKDIKIAVPYEVDTVDPHAKNTLSNFAVLSHFYEPLVTTDASMRILPCLASYWETPDPSTWIFHLQPTVTFHSGKRLRAEDVVYSLQRVLNSQELEMAGYLINVQEVKATGPLTVQIRTTRPVNIFLNKLRFILIVPQNAGPDRLREHADGTGPFRLQAWNRGNSIWMIRNENYWRQKPALRQVFLYLSRTPQQAIDALRSGEFQLVQCNSKELEKVLQKAPRFQMLRSDSIFLKYLGCDLYRDETPFCDARPNPFRNRLVREAIRSALNVPELVKQLPTYAVQANQPIPPFIFGYNPQIPDAVYDVEKAKSLLRQAGYPGGFHVTLHTRNIFVDAAQLVKKQLGVVGIHVDVQSVPDEEAFAALRKREYSFFLSRIGCPTGDASDILDNSLHSYQPESHYGAINYVGYANPQVDRAIEESTEIQLIEPRRKAIQQIMRMVMDDLVWIPLYLDQDVYALNQAYSWKPRNDSFILAQEIQPR